MLTTLTATKTKTSSGVPIGIREPLDHPHPHRASRRRVLFPVLGGPSAVAMIPPIRPNR